MSNLDTEELTETLIGALRADVQPMPALVRRQLAARLEGLPLAVPPPAAGAPRAWLQTQAFAVAVSLPLGVALGAAGHAWLAPWGAPQEQTFTPVPGSPSAPTTQAEPGAELENPPVVLAPLASASSRADARSVPNAASGPAASISTTSTLEQELVGLEQARTKLSEGDAAATLKLLAAHRGRYPSSKLEQEREALTIKALAAAGRLDEAKAHAYAFARRYPGSMLRGSVERAAGTNP